MSKRRRNRRRTQGTPPSQRSQRKEQIKTLAAKMKETAKVKKTVSTEENVSCKEQFDPQKIDLLRSGSLEHAQLTTGMANAVQTFRQTLLNRQSTIILNWPNSLPGVSALHSLAFLCELAEGPDRFRGFATVFYPASARTGANQRALLVERDWLISINIPWLNAYHSNLSARSKGSEKTRERFHDMLARINDLRPEALSSFPRAQAVVDRADDRSHPTLFELIARRKLDTHGQISPPEDTFLDRTKRLSKLLTSKKNAADYQRIEAVNPETTPWLLSTIHGASPETKWKACTLPSNRKPDIILVDLQYRARARLDENWQQQITRAISKLHHGDQNLPLFLVTDDPFITTSLKWKLSRKPKRREKKRPLPVVFVRQNTSEILSSNAIQNSNRKREFSNLKIVVEVFASDVARFAAKAMQVRKDVSDLSSGAIARSIGGCLTRLRAIANAPLSQSEVSEVLFDPDEPHLSHHLLKEFDVVAAIAELTTLASQAGALESNVSSLAQEATTLAKALSSEATETTGQLYRSKLQALLKRGTRTLVVTASVSSTQLLERWIESDDDLSNVADRLGEKFDIEPARNAINKIELASISPKPYGHVLLFSTQPKDMLAILSHRACPPRVEIISDASSAKFSADYGKSLLRYWPDTEPGRQQVVKAVDALNSNLEKRIVSLPEFTFGEPSNSGSPIIDLTDQSTGSRSATLAIHTSDGDVIHANPQTIFVTRIPADLEKFENVPAEKITQGREVLVPGPVFLEAVQTSYEFRAAAAPLLANYHNAIRRRVDAHNQGAQAMATEVLAQMDCHPAPTLQSVRRWLNVASQDDVPIELRTPQAPRSFSHFAAFCRALDIDETLAKDCWLLAIVATRGERIRSGLQLRKFYASALIDPDALVRSNRVPRLFIDKIRDLSAEHISEVLHIEPLRTEDT